MKRMRSATVIWLLTCVCVAGLRGQTQAPGTIQGVVLPGTGVIAGKVASSSGRRLSKIRMHLVNPTGAVVRMDVTTKNGEFTFASVSYDIYTVQCMDKDKVIGTAGVTLTEPMKSVDLTCTSDVGFWDKWGLLTGLGAAAAAIGAVGIVAAAGDASGSQ
jgi:hypothetical protein